MRAILLDKRDDGAFGTCYLVRASLSDYVSALTDTYRNFDIQRDIVSNTYLDRLVDTVLNKRHIPTIVLVAPAVRPFGQDRIEFDTFEILDGLQRTFRLQAISRAIRFYDENRDEVLAHADVSGFAFSRRFTARLSNIDSNASLLFDLIRYEKKHGSSMLNGLLAQSSQWFEVWTNLSREQEVNKMLTLNAGHKPVSVRHQLELLFLHLLPDLCAEAAGKFQLVREKEINSTQFSKKRVVGQFHFAHVIAALLSYAAAKPIVPSAALIHQVQDSEVATWSSEIFRPEFMSRAVRFMVHFDKVVSSSSQVGTRWLGREVVLTGVFAAIGEYAKTHSVGFDEAFVALEGLVDSDVSLLNLEAFENVRNSQDLSKINIGNVNRLAVFRGICELMNGANAPIDWLAYFAERP